MKDSSQLKEMALEALRGNWALAVGGFLIYNLINFTVQAVPVAGPIAALIIGGPLLLGSTYFSLSLARKEETRIELLFDGFNEFSRALVSYLLMVLYIILWTFLLIIPGIIKALAYSQTFYILAEDPTISSEAAINKSMAMMDGHKGDYFVLMLSFIGWAFLCMLTFGIGFLFLIPYIRVTSANFYLSLKESNDGEKVYMT